MRIVLTILIGLLGASVSQAEPAKTTQQTMDELVTNLVAEALPGKSPIIKAQPDRQLEVKLVVRPASAKQTKIAFRSLTRQKMKLAAGSPKAATLIRIGHRKCPAGADCALKPAR